MDLTSLIQLSSDREADIRDTVSEWVESQSILPSQHSLRVLRHATRMLLATGR